jgi:hypothetical protein
MGCLLKGKLKKFLCSECDNHVDAEIFFSPAIVFLGEALY